MFGASVAGALVMFLTLQLTGLVNVKPAELSDADRQALQNGRTLNKVWNNLTQKERDHINELAKTAQMTKGRRKPALPGISECNC